MKKFFNYIKLMRPKHYLKNALVFVPIMYSQNLNDLPMLFSVFAAFVALCLIASGIYAVNDIADAEKDAAHPANKYRPIAAGIISKPAAAGFAVFLFAAGFVIVLVFGNTLVLIFTASYAVLFLAYSVTLKHIAVIDCFCIAAGFVLRIYIGGAAMDIGELVSEWLFLTITAGSLFMAFGKRRGEMVRTDDKATARKVLGGYNLEFLNGIIFSCAGVTAVFYALWAMTNAEFMIYTVPLVVFIICKYLLNIHCGKSYGDPVTVIFGDKMLVGAIIVFGALSLVFLYAA